MNPAFPADVAAPGESQAEYERRTAPPASGPLASTTPVLAPDGPEIPGAITAAAVGSLGVEPEPEPDRQVSHHEPVLTQGAIGEPVERLCKLLAHAGFATNNVVLGKSPHMLLDQSVMNDVERFWNAYPDAVEPPELYAGREGDVNLLVGKWVGPHTWQKLYELAGAFAQG